MRVYDQYFFSFYSILFYYEYSSLIFMLSRVEHEKVFFYNLGNSSPLLRQRTKTWLKIVNLPGRRSVVMLSGCKVVGHL